MFQCIRKLLEIYWMRVNDNNVRLMFLSEIILICIYFQQTVKAPQKLLNLTVIFCVFLQEGLQSENIGARVSQRVNLRHFRVVVLLRDDVPKHCFQRELRSETVLL